MDTFDRAEWHSGEPRYPRDLPPEAAGTHLGLFLAWAILRQRVAPGLNAEALLAVRRRVRPGRDFLFAECDGALRAAELTEEAAAFARDWFQDGRGNIRADGYLLDYEKELAGTLPDLYRVADTWPNCDRMAKLLDRRFEQWQRKRGPFGPPPRRFNPLTGP
jgi:hypothetical protein